VEKRQEKKRGKGEVWIRKKRKETSNGTIRKGMGLESPPFKGEAEKIMLPPPAGGGGDLEKSRVLRNGTGIKRGESGFC